MGNNTYYNAANSVVNMVKKGYLTVNQAINRGWLSKKDAVIFGLKPMPNQPAVPNALRQVARRANGARLKY